MKNIFFLSVLLVFLFSSCQSKEIDYIQPTSTSDQLVIFCYFNPDSIWSVHVSRLAGVMEVKENAELALSHAEVELYEENQLLETLEYNATLSYYQSVRGSKPEYGKKYHVKVSCNGYKPVISKQESLPEPIRIDEIVCHESLLKNEFPLEIYNSTSFSTIDVMLKSSNTQLLKVRSAYTLSHTSRRYFDDYLTDCYLLEAKESGTMLLRMAIYKENEEISLQTISPSYFLHEMSYREYDFVVTTTYLLTPNNIYSNIQGGCGLFAGYTEKRIKLADYMKDFD